jgi:GNAT superfamily N-acetyltransferase
MIRQAEIKDIESMRNFLRDNIHKEYASDLQIQFNNESLDKFFSDGFAGKNMTIFLSTDLQNEINGYLAINIVNAMFNNSQKNMVIFGFYVSKDSRKNGIGKLLMNEAEKFAKENNIVNIMIDMNDDAGEKMIEKLGFVCMSKLYRKAG